MKLNSGDDGQLPDVVNHVFVVPSSTHPPNGLKVFDEFFNTEPVLPNTNQSLNVVALIQEIVYADVPDVLPVYDGLPLTNVEYVNG